MDLSETGHFHAAALADWFGDGALDRVYVSPMKRAAQTADPLLRARGLEGTVLEGLQEVDFGDWTGYRWSDSRTVLESPLLTGLRCWSAEESQTVKVRMNCVHASSPASNPSWTRTPTGVLLLCVTGGLCG